MSSEIQKSNLGYSILKFLVSFGLRSYFGHITVHGRENLPHGESYILAPNHQNAFLDALSVLYLNRCRPTVFLARADIFSSPAAARILGFLKMMPVYRSRDGRGKVLERNGEIMEKSVSAVIGKVPFCMMAEGTHNDCHRLLPLKKGMFRIALEAQNRLGEERPVYIVPVGIDYEDYRRSGRGVVLNVGSPVSMLDFLEKYRKSQAVAVNQVLERMRSEMTDKMHHIESEDFYALFYEYSRVYAEVESGTHLLPGRASWERFELRRKATESLELRRKEHPETLADLPEEINGLQKRRRITGNRNFRRSLALVMVFAAAVSLSCFCGWQVLLAVLLASPVSFLPTHLLFRNNGDPQFIGSLNFATQFSLNLVYLVVMTSVVFLLQGWKFGIVMFVIGLLGWRYGSSMALPR